VPAKKKSDPAERIPRSKPAEPLPASWEACARAVESRKAADIRVLDLRGLTSFADYFVLCTGTNTRQIQAIADEVLRVMKGRGERPLSVEGYDNAEWILLDFGDLLVHVFSEKSRNYYDLDRLWRDAETIALPPG
jgi:ribosome-associated protein